MRYFPGAYASPSRVASPIQRILGRGRDINYRDWFVLQDLLRTQYAPYLDGSQFSNMVAECKEILTNMVKMLKSKAVKVIENPKSVPKINGKPVSGPKVVNELVLLQEKISPRPTEVVKLPV